MVREDSRHGESAVTLLDPDTAIAYKRQPFDANRAVGALYAAFRRHSMVNATTLSAQQLQLLAVSDDPSLPMPPSYTW